jgi:hypothetical protein
MSYEDKLAVFVVYGFNKFFFVVDLVFEGKNAIFVSFGIAMAGMGHLR